MEYEEVILGDEKKTINSKEIEHLHMQTDVFFKGTDNFAMWSVSEYVPDSFNQNIIQLSQTVDWVIRKYRGKLYLIALKKDC